MYSFTRTDEKNNEPEPVTHVRECRLPAVWPEHEVLGTSLGERLWSTQERTLSFVSAGRSHAWSGRLAEDECSRLAMRRCSGRRSAVIQPDMA